jgi:hypothetical protein
LLIDEQGRVGMSYDNEINEVFDSFVDSIFALASVLDGIGGTEGTSPEKARIIDSTLSRMTDAGRLPQA